MDLTPLVRLWLSRYVRAAEGYAPRCGQQSVQEGVLKYLLGRFSKTEYGRRVGMTPGMSAEDFRRHVPVVEYEDLREDVRRMRSGGSGILWPGTCDRYAVSSGTSGGRSKYIPVTRDSLRLNHFAGTRRVMAHYLSQNPRSRVFGGKSMILGGSFQPGGHPDQFPNPLVGDLSAHLIDAIPRIAERVRIPSREIALMDDWSYKLPLLQEAGAACRNLRSLSGVPSWFLGVINGILEQHHTDSLADIWPEMEVFFHGGISFAPYREQYEHYFRDLPNHHFVETYNASEGFFATQDLLGGSGMLLLLDCGVYYEFAPLGPGGEPDTGHTLTAWEVEEGKCYALIITAPNGLMRYMIGDTVRVESTEPLRITIAGRTRAYINAFGEEVMVHNTDAALAAACRRTGARAANYCAGPVMAHDAEKGHHRWLIEWYTPPQVPAEEFAAILDGELQAVNSDYAAKRGGDLFLGALTVTAVAPGTFDRYLATTGKLGGQRKVPRLTNTPEMIDNILKQIP